MASEPRSDWSGFLPKRAIVMARKAEKRVPAPLLIFVGETETLPGPTDLLRKMIEAMGLSLEQVAICDIGSYRQLGGPEPRMVVSLGEAATHALLGNDVPLEKLRGQFHSLGVTQLMPTFDPSFLMTHPESKRAAWSDLQAVARELGLKIPSKKG